MTYPLGPNECERLQALHELGILGTEPDPVMDRIAALVCDLFGAPIALVSLIDEHEQWFKAKCGIAVEGTPREQAFCNWTILSDDVFVVEDAQADERLRDNPLVTGEPHIRFYAGAPLIVRPGVRVGSLCVIDSAPRVFTPQQRRQLRDYATIVMAQLRLHELGAKREEELAIRRANEAVIAKQRSDLDRREAELQERDDYLTLAEQMAGIGHWRFEVATQRLSWSAEVHRIHGRDPASGDPDIAAALDAYHPNDREEVARCVARAIEHKVSFEHRSRIVRRDGVVRHVVSRGMPEFDSAGTVTALVGVFMDVTAFMQAEAALRESEERLRLALTTTKLGIWDVDLSTGARNWSSEFKDILGLPETIAPSRQGFVDRLHPEDRARVEHEPLIALPQGSLGGCSVLRISRADNGDERWIELSGQTLLDEDGRPVRVIGTVQDITPRKLAEEALRSSEERLRLALQAGRMFAWERDLTTDHVERSSNARDMLGLGSGPVSEFLANVHPDDRGHADAITRREWGQETNPSELRYVRPDGTVLWLSARSTLFRESGKPDRLIGVTFDISERKIAEDDLWRVANQDPLTGLPNRALFQRRLADALARAAGDQTNVCLLLIDLDDFKDVNDTLGHDAGDALLKETATRLLEFTRASDTVARLGGDEFAVILVAPFDAVCAATLAEQMIVRLSEPFAYADRMIASRASIGLAAYPEHHHEARELLKDADLALYRAKALGRSRVVTYTPEMREATERRVTIAREVDEAVQDGRIVPFYQPKVCFATGRIVGFEALARWQHPTRGVLTPGYFGSAFEDPELAVAIGECLIRQVAADLRSWLDQGLDPGHVAVNLSAAEFTDPRLADNTLHVLRAAGVPAHHLEVEVTETVLLGRSADHVAAILARFHEQGVTVALDDFGTGFASLTHLKQFPVDHIKVDQSFVRGLEHDNDDAAIVAAVIGLGRNLSMKVTAEGVETSGQAERLRRLGCDYAQGYLYAKPMVGSRVPWLLETWAHPLAGPLPGRVSRAG